MDSKDPTQPKFAHGGLRCVKIDGQKPEQMCKEGLGFWSPSLPARPRDTYDISYHVRGRELNPSAGKAVTAFADFSDATGQHRQRITLPASPASGKPLTGTFAWTRLAAPVNVLTGAQRIPVLLPVPVAQAVRLAHRRPQRPARARR